MALRDGDATSIFVREHLVKYSIVGEVARSISSEEIVISVKQDVGESVIVRYNDIS